MWKDYFLKAEKEDEAFGHKSRKPATDEEIKHTKEIVQKTFNIGLPEDYVGFLQFRNGFGFEGLLIYSAVLLKPETTDKDEFYTNIIDANKQWRNANQENKNYLILAESGMYLYCLDLITERYEQQDRVSRDVLQSYPDFFHMIADAVKTLL